jgi:hypothetical protein
VIGHVSIKNLIFFVFFNHNDIKNKFLKINIILIYF